MKEVSNNPILNRKHYYNFILSNKDEEFAVIHDITNPDNQPIFFKFAMSRLTEHKQFLINYLKDRLTPLNRIFLLDQLEEAGIDPNDWITRLKLCNGRHMEDNVSVEVVDLGFGD